LHIEALNQQGQIDPNFNESGNLYVLAPPRVGNQYINPNTIQFNNGVAETYVRIYLADTVRIILSTPSITDTSQPMVVTPGTYTHILLLWPGEIYEPGTMTGRSGQPDPSWYITTDTVQFSVLLTDSFYNQVVISDTVSFQCLNQDSLNIYAQLPQNVIVGVGVDTLSFIPRVASVDVKVIIYSNTIQGVEDTSTSIQVLPGEAKYLIPVLPGETLLPGDTTGASSRHRPGKKGAPSNQIIDRPFNVDVYVVDAAFNVVQTLGPVSGHSVDVIAYDQYNNRVGSTDGPKTIDNAITTFTVTIPFSGIYNVFVQDITDPAYNTPWFTKLTVESRAGSMNTWASPSKINVGQSSQIYAQVYTYSGRVLPGKTVYYKLIRGKGTLSPTSVPTDNRGKAYSVYRASETAQGDTALIRVRADTIFDTVQVVVAGVKVRRAFDIYPNPFIITKHGLVSISYKLLRRRDASLSKVKISIFTPLGELVWEKTIPVGAQGARLGEINTVYWNGKNGTGSYVSTGMYDVYVSLYRGGNIYKQFHKLLGVVR